MNQIEGVPNVDIKVHGIHLKENKHRKKSITKLHYHDVFQILYVLENKGEITFNNQSHVFAEDSLAFITPFTSHSINSDEKMTVLMLEFDMEKLDGSLREILQQHAFQQTSLQTLSVLEIGGVRKLLRRMLYEQSLGEAINIVAVKVYLAELLLILLRHEQKSNITDANELRAERLREYIETHYFEITDSNDISQKLGISIRHVNTIFKEQFNTTPMNYLNRVRMEVAKKLLLETDKDIVSICFEIGFEAISTFYRRFKDYTNLSPNQYRLQHYQNY